MGRRRGAGSSSSSSYSMGSSSHYRCTDLSLGLHNHEDDEEEDGRGRGRGRDRDESGSGSGSGSGRRHLFVKVYMEGIAIGRKLNLLANDGYNDLISTLHFMFDINLACTIQWSGFGVDGDGNGHYDYVLTYQDKEGDWMMVGDVPWEMFLSTVQRLKISKPYRFI